MGTKVKALFGFSAELAPFAGQPVSQQVELLAAWGVNAVFGGYQNPQFVAAAHAAGINVYAEFGCFVGLGLWEKFPVSRPITETGQPLEPEGGYYGVNPSVPEVRQDRLEALERLVSDCQVDGVWLDFIRWPCRWESPSPTLLSTSFDERTLARFRRDTGVATGEGSPVSIARGLLERHAHEWIQWRCEQISSWVAEAKSLVWRLRPGAVLGLFGVPWRLADHDGAILRIVGQDYRALGQHVDVFSPMVYHHYCGQPTTWIGSVTEEVHRLSGRPVWPIIQSVDEPSPLSAEEYGKALDVALTCAASDGVIVFTLEGMLGEEKLATTRARLRSATQGPRSPLHPDY